MKEVIVVCEGQTEEVFVNELLGPVLGSQDVFLSPRCIKASQHTKKSSPHSKGGSLKGQRVLSFLRNTLRQRRSVYVTTFFDLYGLPPDFPGWFKAAASMDPVAYAAAVEKEFHTTVIDAVECRRNRFFPHIQPYEFEALLFSDTERFAEVDPAWRKYVALLKDARQSVRSPEHINHGEKTHPSARLQDLLRPRYKKVRHGRAVSERIGVDRMRNECSHFNRWLAHMETLPPLQSGS